ncbi:MAG: ATPase domain-containing protein, partial [Planctomycetota bacterium]
MPAGPVPLREVSNDEAKRRPTGIGELDRVLGGGAVPGSVVLVGGEPGVGKSTLLLGFAARAGPQALYVAGEESPAQVAQRARRLGLGDSRLALLDETDTDRIASEIESRRPAFAVVDSVQSLHAAAIDGITGGPAQVRGAAERLVPVARASGCALFLVGQVTKEGGIAGPRTLEHAVDAVLYFEGERHMSMRALRAVKNRFGPCDEVGLFEMKEEGLAELRDAQALLTPTREVPRAGAVVGVALEGRRALCLEVEALAVGDNISMPRRRGQGLDPRRLEVLAGCLSSHIAESLSKSDLYVNVVGGLTVRDPGLDAAVAVAILGGERLLRHRAV